MSSIRLPRRALLGAAGGLAFSGAAPAQVASEAARPKAEWGVSAGDVVGDRAIIWSRADRTSRMVVEWSTDTQLRNATRVHGPAVTEASDYTGKLDLVGLPGDSEIHYRVSFEGQDAAAGSSAPMLGKFRTAPSTKRDVKFLWSGDTAGQGWGINEAFGGMKCYETMRRNGGDFFIHCGDTIYADGPMQAEVKLADGTTWKNTTLIPEVQKVAETLGEFRGRHRYNVMDKAVRGFNAEMAQLWMWDDHEVSNNYSDSKVFDARYAEKFVRTLQARGRQAFFEYAPIRAHGADEAQRVYRKHAHGPHLDVFALDMRSYRGPNGFNREATATPFLGRTQVQWLIQSLLASTATWKVIAADMPIGLLVPDGKDAQGRNMFEAIANGNGPALGRELEIAELLSAIKHAGIRNVVWLTADVHYTAAHHYSPERAQFKDFNPFWEFVSGPLHAGGFGPADTDDTFGLEVVYHKDPGGRENSPPTEGLQFFGECAIEGRSGVLHVRLKDLSGATLWERALEPEA